MREYELVFIPHPDLDENGLNDLINKVRGWITDSGGEVLKTDLWGKRKRLVRLAGDLGHECNTSLSVVSGGSSNVFRSLVLEGESVPGMNQLRIGTAILLGLSASIGPRRIQGFHQDTFLLEAELIEVKSKDRALGILALGTIDVDPQFLFPTQPGIRVLTATSNHTLVDLTESRVSCRVGERLVFELGYPALTRLIASDQLTSSTSNPFAPEHSLR